MFDHNKKQFDDKGKPQEIVGRKTTGPINYKFLFGQLSYRINMNKLIKRICLLTGICSTVLFFISFNLPSLAQEASDYDSLIVVPKEKSAYSKRMGRVLAKRGILKYQKIKDNIYVIHLDKNDKEAKITELQESGLFELVEPDYKLVLNEMPTERVYTKITVLSKENKNPDPEVLETKEITPNDKGFGSQYYLREINATKAWSTTVGNSLLVGILDTGVDQNHPDLAGKVTAGTDNPDYDLNDQIGHGTEVAGIIAANTNNNLGIAGISWNTKVLSLRITDDVGQARVSTVVKALEDAYNKGAKIVQISLSTNQFSHTLRDSIQQAQDRGILVVSTAGNTGVSELRYPAAFDGVIGVGATNQAKEIESYSTRGEHVDLVAPGTSVYTTSAYSSYETVTGTSFSSPQIAGAAALVWSIVPTLTNEEVSEILINSADDLGDPGKDEKYGNGILNIEKAVKLAKEKKEELEEQNE